MAIKSYIKKLVVLCKATHRDKVFKDPNKVIIFDTHYFRTYKIIFCLLGCWHYQTLCKRATFFFSHAFFGINLLTYQVVYVWKNRSNADIFFPSTLFIVGHIYLYILRLHRIWEQRNFARIHDEIENDWINLRSQEDYDLMHKSMLLSKKLVNKITILFVSLILIMYMTPLIPKVMDIIKPLNHPRPNNFVVNIELLIKSNNYDFICKYFYTSVGLTMAAMYFMLFFNFDVIIINHNCTKYDFVSSRLNILKKSSTIRCCNENILKAFKCCIKYHVSAIRYSSQVNHITTVLVLMGVVSSLLAISLAIYTIQLNFSNPSKILNVIPGIFLSSFNLLTACILGEHLILHSKFVKYCCYALPWFTFASSTKSFIMIMLCRCTREIHLDTFGLFVWSMENCLKVIQTAFTCFTVFWSVRGEE